MRRNGYGVQAEKEGFDMRCEEVGRFGGVGGGYGSMEEPFGVYDNVAVYHRLNPGRFQMMRKELRSARKAETYHALTCFDTKAHDKPSARFSDASSNTVLRMSTGRESLCESMPAACCGGVPALPQSG